MIDDGKATITIKELDELRSANKRWEKHYKFLYEGKLAKLEEREQELKGTVDKYLIAYKTSDFLGFSYLWLDESQALKLLEEKFNRIREQEKFNYLVNHSIKEIRREKRKLEKSLL